jgi:hypothetical protein
MQVKVALGAVRGAVVAGGELERRWRGDEGPARARVVRDLSRTRRSAVRGAD